MNSSDCWADYAHIQRKADSPTLSPQTWAIDETLDVILDEIERGKAPSRQQIDNLITNRSTKYRRRGFLLDRNGDVLLNFASNDRRLEARYYLNHCRRLCSAQEWGMLLSIDKGYTYGEIAVKEGVPEATIKTRVRRLRLRLEAYNGRN